MKEGDIVICIDNKRVENNITMGKRYEVLCLGDKHKRIRILDDKNISKFFH